jgi:predicted MFS family arabinose efflux permease
MSEQVVGPRAAWRVLRRRDFGLYFLGNSASATGGWFHNLAAGIFVYRLTGSELLLGVLSFSQFAWVLVLAPWAGALADRFDRRLVLLWAELAATALSFLIAGLAYADRLDEWSVIGITLALGLCAALAAPAQQAIVVTLVPESELSTAVALNSMTFNLARALGPALAALAIGTIGLAAAFAVNAFSYLVLVAALLIVRTRPQERAVGKVRLRESLALVRDDPRLLAYLLIVAAVGWASDPVNTLAPAFAEAYGYRDTVGGVILGAFGTGAVCAAIVLAGRTSGSARRMAFTLTLLGGGLVLFSLARWLPLGLVFVAICGAGYLASNTSATTRLQLGVAESQRGRIMALWGIAFLGVRPFASLLDGAIATVAGVRVAGVVLALPALAGAGIILAWPRLGRVRAPAAAFLGRRSTASRYGRE